MGQPRSRAKTSNLPDRSPFSDFMGLYDIAARKTKAVLATPDLTSAFSTDSTEPEPRWNFESLKDLPTIQQPVVPLPISQTWIPSPFVPGLYPNHVESIKNRLAGTGDHKYGGSGSGFLECGQGKSLTYSGLSGWTGTGPQALGNGKNIWNAWKRAFDLWNDYYIEGRVDTKEVGKELLAVEKEQIQKRRGQNVDSANPGDASLADSEAEFLKDHPWREHVQTLDDAIRDTGPGIRGIKWVIPEPPFNGVDQDRNWEDPIENTVWMPVVCGETKPMFNWDIHTERLTSDNEHKEYPELDEHALYGGYDCSIMPTPVLRPIERYGFNRSNNERDVLHVHRVRMWDGVSNTVFNIPTKPFSDDSDLVPVDNIVQRAYRSAADELEVEGTPVYFPLNIRRIERLQISKPIDIPHIGLDLEGTANADRLLEKTKSNKLMSLGPSDIPNVSLDDPWYFTPTEQELRRQIDRSVPKHDSFKPQSYDRSLLEYEIKRDVYKYAEYFITNLDGRTLIVNGLEVRRGQVAGPLPKFAIIECPGGNVVFWWGNGGRNKGKDRGRIDYASVHKAWLTKRHEEGDADLDWKTIRRTRRSVWRSLIKVKMEKVANHEEKLDPAWAAWMEQARMEEEGLGLRGGSAIEEDGLSYIPPPDSKRQQAFDDDDHKPKRLKSIQQRQITKQGTTGWTRINREAELQEVNREIEGGSTWDFVAGPNSLQTTPENYKLIVATSYGFDSWEELLRLSKLDINKVEGLRSTTKVQKANPITTPALPPTQQKLKANVLRGLDTAVADAATAGLSVDNYRHMIAVQNNFRDWETMVKKLDIRFVEEAITQADILEQIDYGMGYWTDQAQVHNLTVQALQDTLARQSGYGDFAEVLLVNQRQVTEPDAARLTQIMDQRRKTFAKEARRKGEPNLRAYKDGVALLYGFADWDDCESKLFGTYNDGQLNYIPPPEGLDDILLAIIKRENRVSRRAGTTVFTVTEIRRMEVQLAKRRAGAPMLPARQDDNGVLFCEL